MLQHADRVRIAPLGIIGSAQIVVTSNTVRSECDDLRKHRSRLGVASLVIVKRSQPAIAGPVMRPQFDRSAVGSFRVRELTQAFIGICQTAVGVVVSRLGRDSALKLCGGILVMSSPLVNRPQANIRRWESLAQS